MIGFFLCVSVFPYCGNFTLVFIERCSAFLRPVHVTKRCATLFRDVLLHVLHLGPSSWRKLSGKGCTVCAAARNLGSLVLDDVCRRRNIRAQGFMLLDGGSMHGLSRRNNALSDRKDRASSSSFPESSAARFCDFSSHFMALAKHTSLSLASHPTTACNSVFTESLLLINSSVDFFDPELSCCFCCTCCHRPPHALSHASGQSRPHSTQTSPSSP